MRGNDNRRDGNDQAPNYLLYCDVPYKTTKLGSYTECFRLSTFILPKKNFTLIYSSPNSVPVTSPKSLHRSNQISSHTPQKLCYIEFLMGDFKPGGIGYEELEGPGERGSQLLRTSRICFRSNSLRGKVKSASALEKAVEMYQRFCPDGSIKKVPGVCMIEFPTRLCVAETP